MFGADDELPGLLKTDPTEGRCLPLTSGLVQSRVQADVITGHGTLWERSVCVCVQGIVEKNNTL